MHAARRWWLRAVGLPDGGGAPTALRDVHEIGAEKRARRLRAAKRTDASLDSERYTRTAV